MSEGLVPCARERGFIPFTREIVFVPCTRSKGLFHIERREDLVPCTRETEVAVGYLYLEVGYLYWGNGGWLLVLGREWLVTCIREKGVGYLYRRKKGLVTCTMKRGVGYFYKGENGVRYL